MLTETMCPTMKILLLLLFCNVAHGNFDSNRHCPAWAKQGECQRNPKYMLVYCKKSCSFGATEWECKYRYGNYYGYYRNGAREFKVGSFRGNPKKCAEMCLIRKKYRSTINAITFSAYTGNCYCKTKALYFRRTSSNNWQTCLLTKKIHPCKIKNGGCNQQCTEDGDNAVCSCNEGYELGEDKKTCTKGGSKITWSSGKDKIWDDGQCPNTGNGGLRISLSACKKACEKSTRCNAINYSQTAYCVFRYCTRHVPPRKRLSGYRGYSTWKGTCPALSTTDGRCGAAYGRCATSGYFCNTNNEWCGNTDAHRDASPDDLYDNKPIKDCTIKGTSTSTPRPTMTKSEPPTPGPETPEPPTPGPGPETPEPPTPTPGPESTIPKPPTLGPDPI